MNRSVLRLLRDVLRERQNARFVGQLVVREGVRRLQRTFEPRRSTPAASTAPKPPRPRPADREPEPIVGYDLLSVPQVIESYADLPTETRSRILRYEAATRRRSAILQLGDA